jgi:hypothetical protein
MEKFLYYTRLFDCYKKLLSENECATFSSYYEDNLSMQEIADNKGVSKSAVGASLKNTEMKLTAYEQALHLEARLEKIRKLIPKIKDEKIRESLEQILN